MKIQNVLYVVADPSRASHSAFNSAAVIYFSVRPSDSREGRTIVSRDDGIQYFLNPESIRSLNLVILGRKTD